MDSVSHLEYYDSMEIQSRTGFNLYLTHEQYALISRLQSAGVSMSCIARQAVRKCSDADLEVEDDSLSRPQRVNLYLEPDDVNMLKAVQQRVGIKSRAKVLRCLIAVYLRICAPSIDILF